MSLIRSDVKVGECKHFRVFKQHTSLLFATSSIAPLPTLALVSASPFTTPTTNLPRRTVSFSIDCPKTPLSASVFCTHLLLPARGEPQSLSRSFPPLHLRPFEVLPPPSALSSDWVLLSDLVPLDMDNWRVAVLGDGGVGKTALAVQVYITPQFCLIYYAHSWPHSLPSTVSLVSPK